MSEKNFEQQNIFCSSCGASNNRNSKFCSSCGEKIHRSNEQKLQNTNSSIVKNITNKQVIRIVISLIIGIFGYKAGSTILPRLTLTVSQIDFALNYDPRYDSYLYSTKNAYDSAAFWGGVIGAILFFTLGLIIMKLIVKD